MFVECIFALQRTCLLHGPPGRRLIQGDGWAETTVGSGLFCTSTLHQNGENQNDWKSMTAWCWKPVHQDLTPVHTSSQVCVRFLWQRGSNEAKVNELLSREARFPHVKPFVTAVVLGARPWVFRIARAFFFWRKALKAVILENQSLQALEVTSSYTWWTLCRRGAKKKFEFESNQWSLRDACCFLCCRLQEPTKSLEVFKSLSIRCWHRIAEWWEVWRFSHACRGALQSLCWDGCLQEA